MIYNDNAKISTKIMNQLVHFILVCRSISVQLQGYIYIYIYILIILPKINRLVSIERWWLQDSILKAKNKSEETGQRSSDDEVSKFILHNRKREFF